MYSLYSRKLQGLPNNFLHTIKTTRSIYFIWLYIFNDIPKQKMLKGKDTKIQKTEAFHHAIDPRPTKEACVWLLPVLVAQSSNSFR